MVKSSGVMLAISLLVAGLQPASATPSETWVISSKAACQGLTVSWTPTLANLQLLVGERWHPAPGPLPGHGILLLFATSCPQSHIGNKETGPFTIGVLIVPVETPADTHGVKQTNGHGWAVVADVLGPHANPVVQLFKRHAFAVTDANVRLTMRMGAKDIEPTMSIVTPKGHMEVNAQVSGPAKNFDSVSALAGNDPAILSLFTGQESASRQEQGTAIITSGGDTWVSRLGLNAKPTTVKLDQDFVWSFTFSDQPY
ncbi:MAG: hypothetical protein KGJ08_06475 [Gammaproteobacteria bacterium]|nr:hypothetical protein [Gammaproteobacteria bacterium]